VVEGVAVDLAEEQRLAGDEDTTGHTLTHLQLVTDGYLGRESVRGDQHEGAAVVFKQHDRALLGFEQLDRGLDHALNRFRKGHRRRRDVAHGERGFEPPLPFLGGLGQLGANAVEE
jgi:hypothetical protein